MCSLVLVQGLQQLEEKGLTETALLTGLSCLASVGEDVPTPAETGGARLGWYPGRTSPFSEVKGRGMRGRSCVKGD